ncbi:hypothetical protein D9M68_862390 [compost metagenome]
MRGIQAQFLVGRALDAQHIPHAHAHPRYQCLQGLAVGRRLQVLDDDGLDAAGADQRQRVARRAAVRVVVDRDGTHAGCLAALRGACSYQARERLTTRTTSSITGTSISTPTTVASAAPDWKPNRLMAAATASSKKLLAPISAEGQAMLCFSPTLRLSQ